MLRRAALYGVPNSGAEWHKCYSALFSALEERFGVGRVWQRTSKFFDQEEVADDVAVAVIQGLQGQGFRYLAACLELGIPTLVVDLGWLRRERGYWQVSPSGLNVAPSSAPSSDRFEQLGLLVFDRIKKDYSTLIVGQIPGDKQHDLATDADVINWAVEAARAVKKRETDHRHRVFWRPHPRFMPSLGRNAIMTSPNRLLKDFLKDSLVGSAVVYNSTLGLDLLRNGVSIIAQGPRTVYTDLVSANIEDLHSSYPGPERVRALLERVAYGQYQLPELANWSTLERLFALHEITGDW